MKMKVLHGLFLSICIMAMLVFGASAQDTDGDWTYKEFTYNDVIGVEVVSYTGSTADVYVPAKLGGKPVLKIGDGAFKDMTGLNSVTFSSDIKVLGNNAFEGATGLLCVLLNEGLVEIGDDVFDGCTSFNSIILYNSIATYGESIFTGCTNATLYYVSGTPGETYALAAVANSEVKGAEPIGGEETYLEVDANDIHFYILNGEAIAVYQNGTDRTSINIPAVVNGFPVTRIQEKCFSKDSETYIGFLSIPSTVRKIGEYAFENCNFYTLQTVTLPEGLEIIEPYAFSKTQGNTFVFPDSITTISDNAFRNSFYNHFEFSENSKLKYIGDYAFASMSGKHSLGNSKGVYIPESVEYLGSYAFYQTWLSSITICNKNITLGDNIFYGSGSDFTRLSGLYIPNGLLNSRPSVWTSCNGANNGPSRVYITDIADWTVNHFWPKSYSDEDSIYLYCLNEEEKYVAIEEIPEGVTDINGAFNHVENVTKLKLPSTVTTIGAGDLLCYSITALEFSTETLTTIESGSVAESISTLYIDSLDGYMKNLSTYAQNPLWHAKAVYEKNSAGEYEQIKTLTIPGNMTDVSTSFCGASSTYPATWFDTLIIGEHVTAIRKDAFKNCPSLKTVYINVNPTKLTLYTDAFDSSNSITTCYVDDYEKWGQNVVVGNAAANPLTNATTVYFNNELTSTARIPARTSIPSYLFAGKWVRSVVFDESDVYRTLESNCFAGCTTLESIILPDSLTTINASAFNGCTALKSIVIPDNVSAIGDEAFYNCGLLETVELPASLTAINSYSFYNCTALKNITIPANVQKIDRCAFANCTALETVLFEDGSVLEIAGLRAFEECSSLSSITLPESVITLGDGLFGYCSSLSSFIIPPKVTKIPDSCFIHTAIEKIDLGSNVATISSYAFRFTPLKSIDLTYVTSLGTSVFEGCTELTSVDMSNFNVIDTGTFRGCTKLENVVLSDNLVGIGLEAFNDCTSLTEISLPNTLTTLNYSGRSEQKHSGVFGGCTSLRKITLSENLKEIPWYCFQNCSALESLTIPVSVTSTGPFFLDGCTSLKEIYFLNPTGSVNTLHLTNSPKNFTAYVYKDSPAHSLLTSKHPDCTIVFIAATELFAFSEDANAKTATLISCVKSAVGEVTVPETSPNGYTVTSIADGAFSNCTTVTKITLPETIESIGNKVLEGCNALTEINLPEGLIAIGDEVFMNSKIASLAIPEGVKYIGNKAFENCLGITSLKLTNAESIGESAFSRCFNLESIELSGGKTVIGVNAFFGCSALTDVTLSPETEYIGSGAFRSSGIVSIAIPDKVMSIGSDAFRYCKSLSSVTLGNSVESIGEYAFAECSALTSVDISNSVEAIGEAVFKDCTALATVIIPNSVQSMGASTFDGCAKLSGITISESLSVIEESLFKGCTSLKTVVIPASVEEIKENAFGNSGVTSIVIPDTVTVLGESIFESCSNLKAVTLPGTVNSLPAYTFKGCSKLSRVSGIEAYTEFGKESFRSCFNIQPLEVLHSNLEVIKDSAFAYSFTESATGITLPKSIKSIGEDAFIYCTSIVKTRIPEELTANSTVIAKSAFNHNPKMVLWVYADSYGLDYATENQYLYFIIKTSANPEIDYGCAITGYVRYTGGSPAANIKVKLLYDDGSEAQTATTDANGQYVFNFAEVGTYTLRAIDTTAEGNIDTENVAIKRKNVFSVILTGETDLLLRRGWTVSGTANATGGVDSGNPITVTMTDLEGNVIASSTVNNPNGEFVFTNINNDEYNIVAENNNGMAYVSITVHNNNYSGINLTIDDYVPEDGPITDGYASIIGRVFVEDRIDENYPDRIPEQHRRDWIKLTLYDSDGNVLKHTKSLTKHYEEDYDYMFKGLPMGEYTIVAELTVMRPHHHELHENDPKFKNRKCEYQQPFDLKGYAYVEITEAKQYIADDIILTEENDSVATIKGKVTAKGSAQPSTVTLRDVFHHELATFRTGNNGKFEFKNIKDGLYTLTAITDYDGVGFTVVCLRNGKLYTKFFDEDSKLNKDEIHIKVGKLDKISAYEEWFKDGGKFKNCQKDNVHEYKEYIDELKHYYDSLSNRDRQGFAPEYLSRLWEMIEWLNNTETKVDTDNSGFKDDEKDKVGIENIGSIIPSNDSNKKYTVTLKIDRLTEEELRDFDLSATENEDDNIEIISDEQYLQSNLEETAKSKGKKLGKNKKNDKGEETDEIEYFYYNIEFSFGKDGEEEVQISDIAKETDTNGKIRMRLPIPEEYLDENCTSYSLLHVHNGEIVTLADLDDDPTTITVEVDKFSVFALARSYEEQIASYTVIWKNEDGSVIETDTDVLYGTAPSYDGATPEKAGDAEFSYVFKGWSPEITDVTEDVTYTAEFTSSTNTYKVIWKNDDETVLETDVDVPFGTTPTYDGKIPTKSATAQYTYTFSGWEPSVSAITGDVTYTAIYTETVNTYTVTWKNDNGTVLEIDEGVPYGELPAYNGEVPTKDATAEFTYTFLGWDYGVSEVKGDVTYTAVYTHATNKYTVTWKNEDGTVLETDTDVPFGTTPTYNGVTPTKDATAQYTYTFSSWRPEVSVVTGDVTYTAIYTETVNTYTVTWKNDDSTVLDIDEGVPYGELPVYNGETPTKAATAQYTYTFEGWNPTVVTVSGNVTYTAVYSAAVNTYTVIWANYDGTVLETDSDVSYGILPTYDGKMPERQATAEFSYRFEGWTPTVSEVNGDITYKASFVETRNTYTITWQNEDGSVLEIDENVSYGEIPVYNGQPPVKESTEEYTYTFAGWNPEIAIVTEDAAYTATFDSHIESGEVVTVYFTVGSNKITQTVPLGTTFKLLELTESEYSSAFIPEIEGEPLFAYTFFWKLISDEASSASHIPNSGFYLPGASFTANADLNFEAAWVYTDAELMLVPAPEKASAQDYEFVFDVYLASVNINSVTELESGEFTVEVTAGAGKKYDLELIPNSGITFDLDDSNKVLFKRKDGNAAYLVPETVGEINRVLLGSIKITGAGDGTVALTSPVAYRHIVDGDDNDNRAYTVYVRETSANYNVEIPTASLTVTVDFRNTVHDNSYDYQNMTLTVSGGDLTREIVVRLGNNTGDVVVDEPFKVGENVIASAMTDSKYVVRLDSILSLNKAYTVTVRGDGYRTARYTVVMTNDKGLYFWNNVMDIPTAIEVGNHTSERIATFLAGDIVKDNHINIYDLSAVVSYFGTAGISTTNRPEYIKYDLNRDGKIDSADVAYVLVSWGN